VGPTHMQRRVGDVQRKATELGAEACLAEARPTSEASGLGRSEVAGAPVRGGGQRAEVPWERSEYGAGARCPDGADK